MNIKKNGISIFLEGDNSKLPIVFIHGFPFDHNMWKNQISLFSLNFFCVAYDVRGLGKSDPGDGQYTMESFADDLEIVLNEMKLHKPVLCGFSMGGYISLRAIERMEEKFGGLILCDTRSNADSNEGKINRAFALKKINNEGVKSYIEEFIPKCFSEDTLTSKKILVRETISNSEYFSAKGVKGCILAMAGRTDTTEYLTKLSIPALILCGKKDNISPPEVMKEMANKINHSEFHEILKAGHLSPLENPDTVNKHMNNFLKKISA